MELASFHPYGAHNMEEVARLFWVGGGQNLYTEISYI